MASAANLRLTWSGARHRPRPGRVVAVRFFFRRAASPCSRISPATVFSLSRQPASRSAAVIRGDPTRYRMANSLAISAFSRSRHAARGGSSPSFHLQDQDWDTPSARQDTACGTPCASF